MRKGRKSKVDYWLTDEGLELLKGWARDGLIDSQIMINVGIKKTAFYNWLNKYPQIRKAIAIGKQPADRRVESNLYKSANGYNYEETTTTVEEINGATKTTTKTVIKHMPPNPTSAIFWLTNRKPDEWQRQRFSKNKVDD